MYVLRDVAIKIKCVYRAIRDSIFIEHLCLYCVYIQFEARRGVEHELRRDVVCDVAAAGSCVFSIYESVKTKAISAQTKLTIVERNETQMGLVT